MSQKRTPQSLVSPATNSHLKGLQNYYTPAPWAHALAALLPKKRPTIADLQCGDGSLLRGLQAADTQFVCAADIDSSAKLSLNRLMPSPRITHAHLDFLDLLPCLLESRTKFDLLGCNPPFSLSWPQSLLPAPLRNGHETLDSTSACLKSITHLLSLDGECLFIANHATIERITKEDPSLLDHVWFHVTHPSFFPNADFIASILYIAKRYKGLPPAPMHLALDTPQELEAILKSWAHLRPPGGLNGSYALPPQRFNAAIDEAEARINPERRLENVVLSRDGTLRTRVSAFQQYIGSIPAAQFKSLQSLNYANPHELTVQRSSRQALNDMLDHGHWTISPSAALAIQSAMDEYNNNRTPLTPVSQLQRLGWLDENDKLQCKRDFLFFREGEFYEVTSEVAKYQFSRYQPRYKNGKKDEEQISTRGNDLIFTVHAADDGGTAQFTYKHAHISGTYPMEDIAEFFHIPEVPSLATVRPEECAAHESRLNMLEQITS
jgi:hypothetical protein